MTYARTKTALGLILLSTIGLASCGKSVQLETLVKGESPRGSEEACTEQARWSFMQPKPAENNSLDLLFVVDTSASLDQERPRIAATLPSFIRELDAVQDYRIAVMLAHGGQSRQAGRLYSPPRLPLVLDSRIHSAEFMQSALQQTLAQPPGDVDEANGEAGMLSLLTSLSDSHLREIRAQGFYRPQAHLAVIFVTDENDICFPDGVPSYKNAESRAYQKHCSPLLEAAPADFPRLVYSALEATFSRAPGKNQFSLSGIVHLSTSLIPPAATGNEDSLGHGIIELVKKDLNGVLFDIKGREYRTGLAALGKAVNQQVQLQTRFPLKDAVRIVPETLQVQVDGAVVDFAYHGPINSVEIAATSAGEPGSLIEVRACQASDGSSG